MKKFLVVLLAVCFVAALVSAKKTKKQKSKDMPAEETMSDMQEAGEWPMPSSIGDFGVPSGMMPGSGSMPGMMPGSGSMPGMNMNMESEDGSGKSGKKKSKHHHG